MKAAVLTLTLALIFGFAKPAFAVNQPKAKLNVSELVKAAEVIKKNQALFSNPKAREAFERLTSTVKTKQKRTDS